MLTLSFSGVRGNLTHGVIQRGVLLFKALSSWLMQSITLLTAFSSLLTAYKTLVLLPVLQTALKRKLHTLPPPQAVKTIDTGTIFCLNWLSLQALLLC